MKRIMIVPGTISALSAIQAAKKLGLYVITADNKPDNIGHKYSDEYVNVSILDKEALLAEAKRLKIDGIMTFACDLAAIPCAYVAEKMGLQNVGPYESVCILQNKGRFRRFLAEHGFNVPWAKSYSDVNEAIREADTFPYPVIVKPVDSAGCQGVSVVESKNVLEQAIDKAFTKSFSDRFIIEEFLEKEGYFSDSDAFSVNGKFEFMSFNSEGFDENCLNPYTPWWTAWPTTFDESTMVYARKELQRLISLLNMKTALYNISVMKAVNGKVYIMECSPRSGGGRPTETMEFATGSDLVKNMVRSAVNFPIIHEFHEDVHKNCLNLMLHSSRSGNFKELWVNDKIKTNEIYRRLSLKTGDPIHNCSSAKDTIGLIQFCFETTDQLREVMSDIESYVKVIVD